ncbi:Nuclear factor NF-kappa-B p100 subunit [Irineochytrium annulatum]|nr:Nuclear factor NF-kappa-B p100 subunit [Irineochytrium annulatum]
MHVQSLPAPATGDDLVLMPSPIMREIMREPSLCDSGVDTTGVVEREKVDGRENPIGKEDHAASARRGSLGDDGLGKDARREVQPAHTHVGSLARPSPTLSAASLSMTSLSEKRAGLPRITVRFNQNPVSDEKEFSPGENRTSIEVPKRPVDSLRELKSCLNRRVRPLRITKLTPRLSPNIPLTTRLPPPRPTITTCLTTSYSISLITGVSKAVIVADHLARRGDPWVEWLDASSLNALEISYREFARHVVVGCNDKESGVGEDGEEDEIWVQEVGFGDLVSRVAQTVSRGEPVAGSTETVVIGVDAAAGGQSLPVSSSSSVETLAGVVLEARSRSGSGAMMEEGRAVTAKAPSLCWGKIEEYIFPDGTGEGRRRRASKADSAVEAVEPAVVDDVRVPTGDAASVATVVSASGASDILQGVHPTFVIERVNDDTWPTVVEILDAHKAGSPFLLLVDGDDSDTKLARSRLHDIPHSAIYISPLTDDECARVVNESLKSATPQECADLARSVGPHFRKLFLATGLMKWDVSELGSTRAFLAAVKDPKALGADGGDPLLTLALNHVILNTSLDFPCWTVLALCALMDARPFSVKRLWDIAAELLKLDDSLEGCMSPIPPDDGVHPAARMTKPRDRETAKTIVSRVNVCLKRLKCMGLVDMVSLADLSQPNSVQPLDARLAVPRCVRNVVLDWIATPDLPSRHAFFDSLRHAGPRLLFTVSWVGPPRLVGALLDQGWSPADPLEGITPLHLAAIGGDCDTASLLLASGADVDSKDAESRTPIFLAVTYGNLPLVRLLLRHGADASEPESGTLATSLHIAAAGGQTGCARALLRGGAARNPQLASDGSTPLHLAVRNGHVATAVALRQCGSNVHVRDHQGLPALHLAVALANEAMVRALTEWAAPVEEVDAGGNTALHLACMASNMQMARACLDAGASALRRNSMTGDTALHLAIRSGSLALLELLLEGQPEGYLSISNPELTPWPDATSPASAADSEGALPLLHAAVRHARSDMMTLLARYGADLDHVAATHGIAAVHLAVMLPDDEPGPLRCLVTLGANLNLPDSRRRTPVGSAAVRGRVGHLRVLLEAGASTEGGSGKTPLHLAASHGFVEAVRVLAERGARLGMQGSMWKVAAMAGKVEQGAIAEISEILRRRKKGD